MCTFLVTLTVACLVQDVSWPGFKADVLVTLTVACLVQDVSWPGYNVHSSGDTDCGLSCSGCELVWFQGILSGDTDCGLSCFRK